MKPTIVQRETFSLLLTLNFLILAKKVFKFWREQEMCEKKAYKDRKRKVKVKCSEKEVRKRNT